MLDTFEISLLNGVQYYLRNLYWDLRLSTGALDPLQVFSLCFLRPALFPRALMTLLLLLFLPLAPCLILFIACKLIICVRLFMEIVEVAWVADHENVIDTGFFRIVKCPALTVHCASKFNND